MRRWNGWGDDSITYPLPPFAKQFLHEKIGVGLQIPDINYADAITNVPPSVLTYRNFILTGNEIRLRHSRGQSLADWIEMRSGRIVSYPDGVVYPETLRDIKNIIAYARDNDIHLIPYGGGTSVVGHINPLQQYCPNITVNMSKCNRLVEVDETSMLATFEAGISGADLEAKLNPLGITLGHFPQSFEYSTLGGWVATRSCGQQSYCYGRIEDMFAGGSFETGLGSIELISTPASAAGPDIRQMILGSEGVFGIITRVTVRVNPLPEIESFNGIFFPSWETGVNTLQTIAREKIGASMLRLSDPLETETTIALSSKENLQNIANLGFKFLGLGSAPCLLIFGVSGEKRSYRLSKKRVIEIAKENGGWHAGQIVGRLWQKSRFRTPYLRNTLWEHGYALDTLETALPWASVTSAKIDIRETLETGLEYCEEKVLVIAHLSHIYLDGASLYFTFIFRRTQDPDALRERWIRLKQRASETILKYGGTITHQHGVGLDHVTYMSKEKGPFGIQILRSIKKTLDPHNLFNPGKLIQMQ